MASAHRTAASQRAGRLDMRRPPRQGGTGRARRGRSWRCRGNVSAAAGKGQAESGGTLTPRVGRSAGTVVLVDRREEGKAQVAELHQRRGDLPAHGAEVVVEDAAVLE